MIPTPSPNFAIFNTTLGTIPVLLTPGTTPLTVANFLNYVSQGAYTNSIVHRSVHGFVWQAGGFQLTSTPNIVQTPTNAPVPNEFGASNVRGTIAMAKLGTDPNSATSQFFFNESDANAANLDHQNGGFTVFGNVIGTAGLAVMDAIAAVPVPVPPVFASPLDEIPLRNFTAGTAVTPANLILINSVTNPSELFLVSSDSPGVANVSVRGKHADHHDRVRRNGTYYRRGIRLGREDRDRIIRRRRGSAFAAATTPSTPSATTTTPSTARDHTSVDADADRQRCDASVGNRRPESETPTDGFVGCFIRQCRAKGNGLPQACHIDRCLIAGIYHCECNEAGEAEGGQGSEAEARCKTDQRKRAGGCLPRACFRGRSLGGYDDG